MKTIWRTLKALWGGTSVGNEEHSSQIEETSAVAIRKKKLEQAIEQVNMYKELLSTAEKRVRRETTLYLEEVANNEKIRTNRSS